MMTDTAAYHESRAKGLIDTNRAEEGWALRGAVDAYYIGEWDIHVHPDHEYRNDYQRGFRNPTAYLLPDNAR